MEDRRSDVCDVWARVGDAPTLLDSLAEDLLEPPYANIGDVGRIGVQIPRGSDAADECSSSSESCWGEMEQVGDEAVEWGVLPNPPSGQADDRHRLSNGV